LRVLLFGTVDEGPGYPRIRALVRSLELLGARLERLTLPPGWRDRGRLFQGPLKLAAAAGKVLAARRRLLKEGRELPPPDLVLVGYPAYGTADLAKRLWPGVPVLVDLFLSLYDTVSLDRRLWPERGVGARFLQAIDRRTCAAGDLVLLDTEEMCRFAAELTGLPRERFDWIPCGDPDAPEWPEPYLPPRPGEALRLFFAGTGPPLQGVGTILEALVTCKAPVELTLVGGGDGARRFRRGYRGGRIRFVEDWLDRETLGREIRESHLSLGIFGTSGKADRVVPLKVYHGLAEGRPVLTGDSRAVRRLLRPEEEVFLVPRGDPRALAARLEELRNAPGRLEEAARKGWKAFRDRFSLPALAARWRSILEGLGIEAPGGGAEVQRPGKREESPLEAVR